MLITITDDLIIETDKILYVEYDSGYRNGQTCFVLSKGDSETALYVWVKDPDKIVFNKFKRKNSND